MDERKIDESGPDELPGLTEARAGDQKALQDLVQRHLGVLHDQARRHGTQIRGLRESDIVQSAILRVLQGLPNFRGSSQQAFVAWLGAIVKNTVRKKHRFWQTKKRAGEVSLKNADEFLAGRGTPSFEATQMEALIAMAQAMKSLSEAQRRALELRLFEELSYETIAEELETSVAGARMLVTRGRAALALALARADGAS